ncbi:MAG TPA: ribosomal RNA small subunit methyltransferase A [Actinobacteria bacterium]|nr:ribosomal RNA small subunit methyltransferase A [Actinomycetota bacterium]
MRIWTGCLTEQGTVLPEPDTRPTPLQKMRLSGVSPDRALGQNFLIDPNIVDVIERTAALGPDDVVLEVGPGLGVLTERLVQRCGNVHCIELDAALAGLLAKEFGGARGFHLVAADALKLDLRLLEPAPRKFVANLPYNVAVPLVMKSLEELPELEMWCLMLQREIADRLFALPGTSAYGGTSVMARLFAEKISSRPVSGTVFHPRPRVRSSLLAFRRRPEADVGGFPAVRAVVRAAFSHRRKTLANSMAGAADGRLPTAFTRLDAAGRKRTAVAALSGMGLAENTRPQDLTPEQYLELTEFLEGGAGGSGG